MACALLPKAALSYPLAVALLPQAVASVPPALAPLALLSLWFAHTVEAASAGAGKLNSPSKTAVRQV